MLGHDFKSPTQILSQTQTQSLDSDLKFSRSRTQSLGSEWKLGKLCPTIDYLQYLIASLQELNDPKFAHPVLSLKF